IREDGVVLAAGRYLQVGGHGADRDGVDLPLGLGARHAASAAITVETRAIAVSVSQSSGTVRVFKEGQSVLELQQVARRSRCYRRPMSRADRYLKACGREEPD